jgi:hypothetical protein
LERRVVVKDLQWKLETPRHLGGYAHTDKTPRVVHHESDGLSGYRFRRDDDIPLVLSI